MRVLLSAGPTREAIDDVRYLSNRSSGKMGLAIAKAVLKRGHELEVVHGPMEVPTLKKGKWVSVESTREMLDALSQALPECDILIMASAVCDFRPKIQVKGKLKKEELSELKLVKNPDVLKSLSRLKKNQHIVAFSLENNLDTERPLLKLKKKSGDWVVFNTSESMGSDASHFGILDKKGEFVLETAWLTKAAFANKLIKLLEEKRKTSP